MDRFLLQLGIVLFLLGLLTGFVVPKLKNPRMGLSSHLEGVLNGIFLVALGLLWTRLNLPATLLTVTAWLALYGTFANWLATLLAAIWGAGSMMPIAAQGHQSSAGREGVIKLLLGTVSLAMVAVCAIVIAGLRAG
ncbi:MAG: hydrogenase [Chloroflexota bacterium]